MMWALVSVSCLHMRNGFERPQGPTDLRVEQPFNVLQELEIATLRSRILTRVSSNSFSLEPRNLLKKNPMLLNLRECIPPTLRRETQSHIPVFRSLQNHMDSGKHLMRLERETTYDTIKRKWVEFPYLCPLGIMIYMRNLKGVSLKTSRRVTRFSEKVNT